MNKFGYRIGSLRVAKNLELYQAAYLTGIPSLNLQRIEDGTQIPTELMVRDLAKAFEADADDLLRLCQEQHVTLESQTEPRISREAEEHKFFWS